jgi:hypothetical protein
MSFLHRRWIRHGGVLVHIALDCRRHGAPTSFLGGLFFLPKGKATKEKSPDYNDARDGHDWIK